MRKKEIREYINYAVWFVGVICIAVLLRRCFQESYLTRGMILNGAVFYILYNMDIELRKAERK